MRSIYEETETQESSRHGAGLRFSSAFDQAALAAISRRRVARTAEINLFLKLRRHVLN